MTSGVRRKLRLPVGTQTRHAGIAGPVKATAVPKTTKLLRRVIDIMYTVFMEDADGDEIWLARFDSHGLANDLMNNLIRGGIKAWVEEY
jgi:hypothetical protein